MEFLTRIYYYYALAILVIGLAVAIYKVPSIIIIDFAVSIIIQTVIARICFDPILAYVPPYITCKVFML